MIRFILCIAIAVSLHPNPVFGDSTRKVTNGSPLPRFILNKGEAFDQTTQLIWSRCSLGTTWSKGNGCMGTPHLMPLEDAKKSIEKIGDGWRLPTIQELYSIVKQDCTGPAIETTVFPGINIEEESPYWTISRVEEVPILIYCIDFRNGMVDGHSEGFPLAVRLVRNAPKTPPSQKERPR